MVVEESYRGTSERSVFLFGQPLNVVLGSVIGGADAAPFDPRAQRRTIWHSPRERVTRRTDP